MTTLLYVDAENIAFPDFKDYMNLNVKGAVVGKVYGNSAILGDSISDYIRLGFNYVDTAMLSSSNKNVADMKILTDCAFDVFKVFSESAVSVVLITKDCDFLPLVYKLTSMNVEVKIPFLGRDKTMTVPLSTVSNALLNHGYDPLSSDDWMLPQRDYIYDLIGSEVDFIFIDRYCTRKKNKYIRSLSVKDPELALEVDTISKSDFSAKSIYKLFRSKRLPVDMIVDYLNLYLSKIFGKAMKPQHLKSILYKLN